MISYAGVDLSHPIPDGLDAWTCRTVPYADLWEFAHTFWPARNTGALDFRPPIPDRPIELNVLRWPAGATRFATFHAVVTTDMLEDIRAAVVDGGYSAATLTLSDGVDSRSASMFYLPARPLQVIGTTTYHLLTLVDVRYWWWFRANTVTITGGTTTWSDLFGQIGTGLGVSLTVDTVEGAYLKPPESLAIRYEPLPVLLDVACLSVGRRCVRALDGTVRLWSPAESAAQVTANLATIEAGTVVKVAGGVFDLGDV